MELNYRMVIPSAKVGFEGMYGHVLVHRLHLCIFGVVFSYFFRKINKISHFLHFLHLL